MMVLCELVRSFPILHYLFIQGAKLRDHFPPFVRIPAYCGDSTVAKERTLSVYVEVRVFDTAVILGKLGVFRTFILVLWFILKSHHFYLF